MCHLQDALLSDNDAYSKKRTASASMKLSQPFILMLIITDVHTFPLNKIQPISSFQFMITTSWISSSGSGECLQPWSIHSSPIKHGFP
mmetsp:Transcript_26052/g.59002  ORF Transcript_26052/g.59002 Transcript_26052/m.59002 type:complete len:88 (-) Transcript_26052:134-397(-)